MKVYRLEICAGSYESACAACEGGADRIELCSGLSEGGLTPSAGLVRAAVALPGMKKHVLIRPRGGDFLYAPSEVDIMEDDIRTVRELGADGVVVGALTADGDIDMPVLERLRRAAGTMSVTFHRAFDVCADAGKALEQLIAAGCDRVLTSGQARSASEGTGVLSRLVRQARGRIVVMPGCGVTPANAAEVLRSTGATEIHASARASFCSAMRFRNERAKMGQPDRDEYERMETSVQLVRELVSELDSLRKYPERQGK